jgi:hypothetical protein
MVPQFPATGPDVGDELFGIAAVQITDRRGHQDDVSERVMALENQFLLGHGLSVARVQRVAGDRSQKANGLSIEKTCELAPRGGRSRARWLFRHVLDPGPASFRCRLARRGRLNGPNVSVSNGAA